MAISQRKKKKIGIMRRFWCSSMSDSENVEPLGISNIKRSMSGEDVRE